MINFLRLMKFFQTFNVLKKLEFTKIFNIWFIIALILPFYLPKFYFFSIKDLIKFIWNNFNRRTMPMEKINLLHSIYFSYHLLKN